MKSARWMTSARMSERAPRTFGRFTSGSVPSNSTIAFSLFVLFVDSDKGHALDLAIVEDLNDLHDAAVVKALIAANENGKFRIFRGHFFDGLFEVDKGGGLAVEEDAVGGVNGDSGRLVILRRERIGLALREDNRNALFEGWEGDDEGDEKKEREVDQARHIDGRFWFLAPHATASGHVSQPFLGIRTRCGREARPRSLPCRR